MIRPDRADPIANLFPPEKTSFINPNSEADSRRALARLNQLHQQSRADDPRLEARIASYELAARLQLSAPEVLDIAGETHEVRELYGVDQAPTQDFGRRCLIARRLLERGVRFVQIWSGADNGHPRRNWDSHEDLPRDHRNMAAEMDRPAAALLIDLKRRGMLDDTVVLWTTEFGRMPCSQGGIGRDHNPFGFTNWLAGGGVKAGLAYGSTDELGDTAVAGRIHMHDLHATILHQLGLDHEDLTYLYAGRNVRLTDVHGNVLHDILS